MGIDAVNNRAPFSSRAATRVFGWMGYVNRQRLAESFLYSHDSILYETEKKIFRQKLLESSLIQHADKERLGKEFNYPSLERGLKKTLAPADIQFFITVLKDALPGREFYITKSYFFIKTPAAPPPHIPPQKSFQEKVRSTIENFRIIPHESLKNLFLAGSTHPEKLESGLKKTLKNLKNEISTTNDGQFYYLKKDEENLLEKKILYRVKGLEKPVFKENLADSVRKGKILAVSDAANPEYVMSGYFEQHKNDYFEFRTAEGKKLIRKETFYEQTADYKFLFGVPDMKKGEKVLIKNSPSDQKENEALLLNYELLKLTSLLAQIFPHEAAAQNAMNVITSFAEKSRHPRYLSFFKARKALEMDQDIKALPQMKTAVAAIFCDELTSEASFEAMKSKIPIKCFDLIKKYRELSAWQIPLPYAQNQMQNFLGAMEANVEDLEIFKLILIQRLTQSIFRPEEMKQKKLLNELAFFAIPLAEMNLFKKAKEQLKDLFLLHHNPEEYKRAAVFFKNNVKMPRHEAENFLESLAKDHRRIFAHKLGGSPEEIEIYWRAKCLKSIAGKGRRIWDTTGETFALNLAPPRPEESEQFNLSSLKGLTNFITETLKVEPGRIKNRLDVPAETGYQDFKVYFEAETGGAKILVEAIFQTKTAYVKSQTADVVQVHWLRELNKNLAGLGYEKEQRLDQFPPSLFRKISLDPLKNLKIRREARQDVVDFFVLAKDPDFPLLKNIPLTEVGKNIIHAKKIEKGAIPEDVYLSSAQFLKSKQIDPVHPLKKLGGYKIYRFGRDRNGKPALIDRSIKMGIPYQIQDGDILVFTEKEEEISDKKGATLFNTKEYLHYIEKQAVRPHSKFMAWLEREGLSPKDIAESHRFAKDIKTGESTYKKIWEELREERQASLTYYQKFNEKFYRETLFKLMDKLKFKSMEHFFLAVKNRFIGRETLKGILAQSLATSTWHFDISEDGREVKIDTREQKGVITALFLTVIKSGELISLETRGYREDLKDDRMEIKLLSAEPVKKEPIKKMLGTTSEKDSSSTQEVLVLQIPPDKNGRWSNFGDLLEDIEIEYGPCLNVFEANLPANQAGGRLNGIFKLEMPEHFLKEGRPEKKKLELFLRDHGIIGFCEYF